jgi:hypothetical protein
MAFSILGKFTWNEFSAQWDDESGNQKLIGSVVARIEEKEGNLVLFSYYIKNVVKQPEYPETRQMGGSNIPMKQRGFSEHFGILEGFDIDLTGVNLKMFAWVVK